MATQVETLLPGTPLSKPEDCSAMARGELEGPTDTKGGTRPDSNPQPASPKGDCDNNKPSDDSAKGRKEFTAAPPPKVNPWTKKMNPVTVVSVNGPAAPADAFWA
uniref:Uncharacterized protein n=1 Tax=Knipowitschia caucasica TaxID=637954 RepID=A0AAV2JEL6_KNICA